MDVGHTGGGDDDEKQKQEEEKQQQEEEEEDVLREVRCVVGEVMEHLAEDRLEMGALMEEQGRALLDALDSHHLGPPLEKRALRECLEAARSRLVLLCSQHLQAHIQVPRHARLLAQLGAASSAYPALQSHILSPLHAACNALLSSLHLPDSLSSPRFFVDSASRLLTLAMDLLVDHQGLLVQHFGVARFFETVLLTQQTLDPLMEKFFQVFLHSRVAVALAQPSDVNTLGPLGLLLDEMTQLSLRCEIYAQFVDQTNTDGLAYAKALGQETPEVLELQRKLAETLAHSLLRRGNLEAMSNYAALETRFLSASLLRTRLWESSEDEGEPDQSSNWIDVDGCFFVLSRSGMRALQGRNTPMACAVLASLAEHVELDIGGSWLDEAWKGQASRSRERMLDLMNRMLVSAESCRQLKQRLEAAAIRLLPERGALQAAECVAPLDRMADRFECSVKNTAKRHIAVVVDGESVLGQTLDKVLSYNGIKPGQSLSAELASSDGILGPAVRQFLANYGDSPAASTVANAIALRVAADFEKRMLHSGPQFTQEQAVRLEWELQCARDALRARCAPADLRDALGRVRLMATLLAVERAEDAPDLWRVGGEELNPEDVRALLARRVDMTGRQLTALKFRR